MKLKAARLGIKVSLIVALMISVIIIIIVFLVSLRSSAIVVKLATTEAEIANKAFHNEIDTLQNEAFLSAQIIASSREVIDDVIDRDSTALKQLLMDIGSGVDTVMVVDTNGDVIVRKHSDQSGDNVISQDAVSIPLSTGTGISTIAEGATVGLATRGSAAIKDLDGNIIGAVVCGHDLSSDKYVDAIKTLTTCDASIFIGSKRISTTLFDENGDRAVGTSASEAVVDTVINQKQIYSARTTLFNAQYAAYYSPLSVEGKVVGMLFTGISIESALADQRSMMTLVIIVGIICGLIGIATIISFSHTSITKPLHKITTHAEMIAIGDIEIEDLDLGTKETKNEVILLERAFAKMVESFKQQAYILARLAEGDYTSKVTVRSEKDVISLAIQLVLEETLGVLYKVATVGVQVADGSNQIADGAHTLAQGSNEQVAVVKELSDSMSKISQKTRDNADMAGEAASLSDTIKHNAEKGSQQMSEMMSAVKDINQASQSISKVIKVIDEIAFQTNILALNAAVEAARAGQHGKGFAVVAEEVRNLAAKSAEAAKETGAMIEDSIAKASLGSRIADETAKSLEEIVSGVVKSTQLINEIAVSSNEQYLSIEQINSGVERVAQVVQQNSVTAEESARVSDEMRNQSKLLESLIQQFQIRDHTDKSNQASLPQHKY